MIEDRHELVQTDTTALLPDELLGRIFANDIVPLPISPYPPRLVDNHIKSTTMTAWCLSKVGSRWRSIVPACSELWTTVLLDIPPVG
ncbi:hypothetical protein BDV98DRAFT_575526 [Pterulicium gracile]|uniref:Uncharacterized protein n=1 Tax=Pterulicium gracile TaxID=1884261 RepID=A0A5C3QEQ7_9AGAR|nr:hypothetical protein BDV98DRAFT_575526 [Pterula gracilis]